MDEEQNLVDREETADAPVEDDQVLHIMLHLSKLFLFCLNFSPRMTLQRTNNIFIS